MNDHDSKKIGGLLAGHGFSPTSVMKEADLILFNTCTIRARAQQKALSDIGRTRHLKRKNPSLMVGVCGCVPQHEKESLFTRFPHIDMLFGPDQIPHLPRLIETVEREHRQVAALDLINTPEEYEFLDMVPWTRAQQQSGEYSPTAFVTIMKGCDANCAYCIVPRVRGEEVCRPAIEIINEVRELAESGVREVMLLGQTVNTYGSRRHANTIPFHELLERIANETKISRIRFISPHPKDVNEGLANAYRDNDKLCKSVHLPLQSGSDEVLRAMRRSYSCKHYLAKVDQLRSACPEITITTDFIVGFPGETDQDFENTLEMVRSVAFDGMYAYAYSPRPGTESFNRMEDNVPEEVKRERLAQLLELNGNLVRRKLENRIGEVHQVLVEGKSKHGGEQWMGRTTHNIIVNFSANETHNVAAEAVLPPVKINSGDLLNVQITAANGYSVSGVLV